MVKRKEDAMRIRRYLSAVTAVSFLLATAAVARGQTVYTNFGPNNGFSAFGWCISGQATPDCGTLATRWIAAPFTPTRTASLATIILPLANISGVNGAIINLHNSDSGGFPGNVLESWVLSNLPGYGQQ